MSTIDVSSWAKRNLWPTPSGEMAVRPGLRKIAAVDSSRLFVGGFSVPNGQTGEVWHYLFDVASSGARALKLHIYDENFAKFQTFPLYSDVAPRVITHAVVQDEIIIASPDFPTLWGLVGSGVTIAEKVASDNTNTTALDVPRGICTSWCNRVVIASGSSLFISDPVAVTGGSPRTFVAENQNQRPGPIYGIHEGAGGQLVALTARGVYGLDASAAAVAVVGTNGTDWRILNHHETHTHASSCVVKGRVFALTRHGYQLVDVEGAEVERLNEPIASYSNFSTRISSQDWRNAIMMSGDSGPIVAHHDQSVCSMHDLARGVRSWWSGSSSLATFSVVATLRDVDGAEMLVDQSGIFAVEGNLDSSSTALTAGEITAPIGGYIGALPSAPSANPTIRKVEFMAAVGGVGTMFASVRGDAQNATPSADTRGLVIGTSSWGASGKVFQPTPLASVALDFNIASNDECVEVGSPYPTSRVPAVVDIDLSNSAQKRTDDRG